MNNTVKITSGIFRGRNILTPGGKTHPMGERERLALFNMVASSLPSAKVLDAFSGSGALGIEAFSRGAAEVTFIEKNPKAVRVIRENLTKLGIEGEVFCDDVLKFESSYLFDLILADPPYDDFRIEPIVNLAKYLKDDGVLVLSHPGEAPTIEGLSLIKTRQYAGATLSVYVK